MFRKLSEEIKSLFHKVVNEISQLLPEIKKTRWSNMVDFYTLFLVLSRKTEQIPFSSDKRNKIQEFLLTFGQHVNSLQKNEDINATENEKNYAAGIRNSSDLGSRKQRYNSLEVEITKLLGE